MLKGLKLRAMLAAIVGLGIHQSVMAAADKWQMNMYRGVTPLSKDMYDLHMIAMVICAIIGLVVFGVMIYSLIHHRKSKGYAPASFHDNSRLEIVWSVIPIFNLDWPCHSGY